MKAANICTVKNSKLIFHDSLHISDCDIVVWPCSANRVMVFSPDGFDIYIARLDTDETIISVRTYKRRLLSSCYESSFCGGEIQLSKGGRQIPDGIMSIKCRGLWLELNRIDENRQQNNAPIRKEA